MKPDNRILIFDPQPNATPDQVMDVLKLFVFQSYPPELRTKEKLFEAYKALPRDAQRHFKLESPT